MYEYRPGGPGMGGPHGPGPGMGGPRRPGGPWGPPPPPYRGGCGGCCVMPFVIFAGIIIAIVAMIL